MPKYDANYYSNMTQSVYRDYWRSKGYADSEVQTPAKLPEFPKTIHGRTFATREEYMAAIHDFLNGN